MAIDYMKYYRLQMMRAQAMAARQGLGLRQRDIAVEKREVQGSVPAPAEGPARRRHSGTHLLPTQAGDPHLQAQAAARIEALNREQNELTRRLQQMDAECQALDQLVRACQQYVEDEEARAAANNETTEQAQ